MILYFILLSLFIYQEKEKAKLITNVIFTTKYSQMHHINNSFNELITLYKKNNHIDFKIFSLKNKDLDKNSFFEVLKKKKNCIK